MKNLKLAAISVIAVLLSTAAIAGDEGYTADQAFKTMLTLEGTWVGDAVVVPVGQSREDGTKTETTVSYKNIGNGSSIMATYLEGTPSEMVSLYHQDGEDTLIHTHYCAVGNQPSMTFRSTAEKGVIDFQFTNGTNMDVAEDYHVHNSYFRIIDEDHFESRSERWAGGKLASMRYTLMTRVK